MAASMFSLTIIILSLAFSQTLGAQSLGIKSARLLDLLIKDYTFQSYDPKRFKTGVLQSIHLPANLSGISVDTVRYRCGSLRRYGAKVMEFHLGAGVIAHPCAERVLIVRQSLGSNWSSIYYDNYELLGYQLVSPIVGLLAYDAGRGASFGTSYEIEIRAGEKPITVDFGRIDAADTAAEGIVPLCAVFGRDGKVTVSRPVRTHVCAVSEHGHYGLVVESQLVPEKKKLSRWKVAMGSSIGAALGAFLLTLLLIALLVKVKKKAKMEELERMAYEEEALQVSMVGHVRTLTAPVTRTVPIIEHEYRPPPS